MSQEPTPGIPEQLTVGLFVLCHVGLRARHVFNVVIRSLLSRFGCCDFHGLGDGPLVVRIVLPRDLCDLFGSVCFRYVVVRRARLGSQLGCSRFRRSPGFVFAVVGFDSRLIRRQSRRRGRVVIRCVTLV